MRSRRPRPTPGLWAEVRVRTVLEQQGWICVSHRWCCRYGELDLVMVKRGGPGRPTGRLLVVEVKSRRRRGLDGWGIAAFDARKRSRLARAIACWRMAHAWCRDCSVELALALVSLPPAHRPVTWLPVADLGAWSADPAGWEP